MSLSRLQINQNPDDFPKFANLNPRIIGHYGIDKDGYTSSAKYLKYLRPDPESWFRKNKGFDLKEGKDTYIRKSYNVDTSIDDKIDHILRWILKSNFLRKISKESTNRELYFICLRGLLKTIMKTPILDDAWSIDAFKVKNIIFLCIFRTEDDKRKRSGFSDTEYFGQKFEQCMRTDNPGQEPNLQTPVNTNYDFCLVFEAKLNGHNLIYGGETDALDSDYTIPDSEIINLDPSEFVELKTGFIGIRRHDRFKKFNLLNAWTQTRLSGVEKILWGFQNGKGKLCHIEKYETSRIPQLAENVWSDRAAEGFLIEFLDFVKETMQGEPDGTYYRFSRDNSNFVVATKMPYPEDYQIIPDWFEEELEMFMDLAPNTPDQHSVRRQPPLPATTSLQNFRGSVTGVTTASDRMTGWKELNDGRYHDTLPPSTHQQSQEMREVARPPPDSVTRSRGQQHRTRPYNHRATPRAEGRTRGQMHYHSARRATRKMRTLGYGQRRDTRPPHNTSGSSVFGSGAQQHRSANRPRTESFPRYHTTSKERPFGRHHDRFQRNDLTNNATFINVQRRSK